MTRYDDDEPFDERGILKDGRSARVPMMMRDAMSPLQRAVAQHSRGGPVGHKPGFVYSTDASLNDAKTRAYAEYDAEQRDAYKYPLGFRGARDVTSDVHNGPKEQRQDTMSVDQREQAYREREDADANAWRGPPDSGKWPIGSDR
jgi:hypothetical protein